jgi:hypothetical protein
MAGLTRVKKHLFNYYRYEKVGNTSTVVELLTRTLPLTRAEVRTFIKDNPE